MMPPTSPISPPSADLVRRLGRIDQFGPKRQASLQEAFKTEAELCKATEKDLRSVAKIGPGLAKVLYGVIATGEFPPSKWRGEARVAMWNTRTQKKVSTRSLPTEEGAEAWLEKRPHCERYTGQDMTLRGPNLVSDASVMGGADYLMHCGQAGSAEELARLDQTLAEHKLARRVVAVAASGGSSSAPAAPPGSSLFDAVSQAARRLEQEISQNEIQSAAISAVSRRCVDPLTERTQRKSPSRVAIIDDDDDDDDPPTPTALLAAASVLLSRPIWVFTGAASEKNVLLVNPKHMPRTVEPLRLAEFGGSYHALVPDDEAAAAAERAEAVVSSDPEVLADAEEALLAADETQLPDLKDDLETSLKDTVTTISETERWSKENIPEKLDLSSYSEPLEGYRRRLVDGAGLDAVCLGDNGVGKSTLVDVAIYNTLEDDNAYKPRLDQGYVLEAVNKLFSTAEADPPTLAQLIADKTLLSSKGTEVVVLEHDDAAAAEAGADIAQLENDFRSYAESPGHMRPSFKKAHFLLPTGRDDHATTAIHTFVRYGGGVHMLVTKYTVAELKQQAFLFVAIRRELGDDDPEDIENEKQKDELKEAWHTFLKVTQGQTTDLPELSDELPAADELPESWSEVKVCDAVLKLTSSPHTLYCGEGRSLHHDRKQIHEVLETMNDDERLERVVAKTVELFVPAAVLEGGCGFIDLPGNNDADPGSMRQIREGIERAGAVFVVLKRDIAGDNNTVKLLKDSGLLARALHADEPLKLVFLFNRELSQQLKISDIDTEAEAETRRALEENTRKKFKKMLSDVNRSAQNRQEPARTEEEIAQIVASTPMRAIYPMSHTACKLHTEFVEKNADNKALAEGVFSHSNMYWFSGVLDALNRDYYVRELGRLVTKTIPELLQKLQSGLDDAAHTDAGLPSKLVEMAQSWLKGANRLTGPFGTLVEDLRGKLRKLDTTGRVDNALFPRRTPVGFELTEQSPPLSPSPPPFGEGYRSKIEDLVANFVEEGEAIADFLARAEERSSQSWPTLKNSLRHYSTAMMAIDPKHNGLLKGKEILPVVFGSRSLVRVDFSQLADDEPESILHDFLQDFKELVIDLLVSSVDQALQVNGVDTQDVVVETLKESFMTCDVHALLDERFSIKCFFMPKRSPPVDLQNGDVAAYFNKLAAKERVTALRDKVLKKATDQSSLGEVHALIENNLETTREAWRHQLATTLSKLTVTQFGLLMADLTEGRKRMGGGLIKQLLRAFLQHIVQTDQMKSNAALRRELSRYINDFRRQNAALHSLWTRLEKQSDPEELGRAAARHVDMRRLREAVVRQAGSGANLGSPAQKMPALSLVREDAPKWWHPSENFLRGDMSVAQLNALSAEMLSKYRLGACQMKTEGYASLFHAVAKLAWGQKSLKSRLLTLNDAAAQLRAVCAAQVLNYCAKKDERNAKVAGFLHEAPASDWKEQYIALIKGNYPGDLFCLWHLACHYKLDFCIWRPSAEKLPPILVTQRDKELPTAAHHLIVTADSDKADGTPIDLSTITPSEYEAQWWFFADDRKVRFSDAKGKVHLLATTDDEAEASTKARLAVPRSTDGVEWTSPSSYRITADVPPPRPTGAEIHHRPEQPTEAERAWKKARR